MFFIWPHEYQYRGVDVKPLSMTMA
jgi:hypothetical protein